MKRVDFDHYSQLSAAAAAMVAAVILENPAPVLGLATGSTPVGMYEELVRMHRSGVLDMAHVTTVNLDEYCGLSESHPQSYRCFMNRQLFSHVNIPLERTFVPNGMAADADAECARYDGLLSALGGADLQVLGLGHDGHIGFNEPAAAFTYPTHAVTLTEQTIQANARFFEGIEQQVPRKAITMGMGAIMLAKKILLLVSGGDKAAILAEALQGPVTPRIPASILQLRPNVTLLYSK